MNKRNSVRSNLKVQIDLIAKDGFKAMGGVSSNLSTEGAFVTLNGGAPKLGGILTVHFKIWTGHENISRQLCAKVLRIDEHGVALGFTEQDLVTFAVVQDILHYRQYERRSEHRQMETGMGMEPAKFHSVL